MSDADVEASPRKKRPIKSKDVKKTAKRRLEKSANSMDKEVKNNDFKRAFAIIFCKLIIIIPFFNGKTTRNKRIAFSTSLNK